MFMCYSNKAYRHQGIKNANGNYPADWIDVGSVALQESLPLSASLNYAIIIHLATNYVKHLFGGIGPFSFAVGGISESGHLTVGAISRLRLVKQNGKKPHIE